MERPQPAPAKTVLVADDEEGMRKVLERRLLSWGYTVVTANDGLEVLRAAKERRPDLILLDVMMPNLDGLEACRQLKMAEETRHIPVILVTAKAAQLSGDQLRDAGVVASVPKPYDAADLLALIQKVIGPAGSQGEAR